MKNRPKHVCRGGRGVLGLGARPSEGHARIWYAKVQKASPFRQGSIVSPLHLMKNNGGAKTPLRGAAEVERVWTLFRDPVMNYTGCSATPSLPAPGRMPDGRCRP